MRMTVLACVLLCAGCAGESGGEGETEVDAGNDDGTDDAGVDASSDADDGGGPDSEGYPEPVVGMVTHQAGFYALGPRREGGGDVTWEWSWDNEGNDGGCFGIAALPSPHGGTDLYCAVMGGFARRRSGATDFEFVGPTVPGETGWQNYFPNWWSGTSGDDVNGDVVCGHFRWQPVAGGRGHTGIYCTHDASSDAPSWERISETLPGFPETGGSTLAVIPRPEGVDPERTAVLATVGTEVWVYRWDDASGSMRWSELEPSREDALRDLPVGTIFTTRLVHPRDGGETVTVFLAHGNAGCVWGGDACPDGGIAYRDFARSGEPIGDRWVDVGVLDDLSPYPSVWRSSGTTGSWSPDSLPEREAVFFQAMFWSGAAYGTGAGSRVIRLEPSGRGWYFAGETAIPQGFVVDGVGVGADPDSPSARVVYAAANRPAPGLGPGRRSEGVVLVSSDYGESYSELGPPYPVAWLSGAVVVDPAFTPGGPPGAGALYLLSVEIVQNAAGQAERRQYDVPFGGLSFGVSASPGGRQLTGNLAFRDDSSAPWQRPAGTEAGQLLGQFLVAGRDSVFFSEWPQSRAPESLLDGGGVYSLPLAGLDTATIEDWTPVWDTDQEPCSPTIEGGTRVPPLAMYLGVDGTEKNLFAVLQNGGWPLDDPYDPWPTNTDCDDGLWRAHRETPADDWTWERLPQPAGRPDSLWVHEDETGEADGLVAGVWSGHGAVFHLLEAGTDWRPQPLDVNVSTGAGECVGSGYARDPMDPALVVVSVYCVEPDPEGGDDLKTSYLRVSRDGGSTFEPLGAADPYDGELGPLVLHTYPDGGHRLFVWASGDGMLVQRDPDDLASLEPVAASLGRSVTTAPGASEVSIIDYVDFRDLR